MSTYLEVFKELKKIDSGKVLRNEPLSRHTTLRIGGPADLLFVPRDVGSLQKALRMTQGMKRYVIGNGSDILMPDRGLKGVVFKLSGGMSGFRVDGRLVTFASGTLLQPALRKLAALGLSGLEFSSWVPAAIGGAVVMNLGAFGEDIGRLVEHVEVLRGNGEIIKMGKDELSFSYRSSNLRDCIVTSVCLKLSQKPKDTIKKRIDEVIALRRETQPLSVPSAGSVFKNPKDVPAGKLIDMAGCKGLRIGGAEISKKHANFIINLGDARSSDVKKIINKIKSTVLEKFKVRLELELVDSSKLNVLS